MAAVLAQLTKLSPGPSAGVPEFNKAMSKLASYSRSHKYQQVLDDLLKSGVIQVENIAEAPVAAEPPVVKAPVEEVKPSPEVVTEPVLEESVTVAEETSTTDVSEVVEEQVSTPVTTETKSTAKKKR